MASEANDQRRAPRRATRRDERGGSLTGPREADLRGRPEAPRTRPANENDAGASMAAAALRRRPSTSAFWAAFAVSLLWIVLCTVVMFIPIGAGLPSPLQGTGMAGLAAALIAITLPILLIWAAAYLLWRAQQIQNVSEALMHAALRLIRPHEVTSDGVTTIAQTIRQEIEQLVGGIEHAVNRAGELGGMVHREIANMERAFGANEERIRTLLAGLENQRNALHSAGMLIGTESNPLLSRLMENTASLESVIGTASTTLLSLEHGLKDSSYELSRTMDDIASRAAHATTEIGTQTARMEQVSGVINNEIRLFSENLSTQLGTLSNSAQALRVESTQFSDHIRSLETNIVQSLRASAGELNAVHNEVSRTFERISSTLTDQLRETGGQMAEVLQSAAGNVTYHLNSSTSEASETMSKAASAVIEQLQGSGVHLSDKLLSVSGEFVQNVARARDDLYSYLEQASVGLTARLEDTTTQLFSRMSERAGQMSLELDQTASKVFGRLETATSNITGQIAESTGMLSDHVGKLENSSVDFAARIENTGRDMSERLITVSGQFIEHVARARQEMSDYFDVASGAMSERLEDSTNLLFSRMGDRTGLVSAQLDEAANLVTERLAEAAGNIDNRFARHAAVLSDHIDKLENASTESASRVESTGRDISERLIAVSGAFVENVARARQELSTYFDETTDGLAERLEMTAQELFGKIAERTGQTAAEIERNLESLISRMHASAGNVTGTLASSTSELAGQIEQTSAQLVTRLETATGRMSDLLDVASTQMTTRLESTTQQLASRLDNASGDMTARLDETTLKIAEQLDSTSDSLTGRLAETSGHVAARLDDTAHEVTERLDGISGQIASRLEDTTYRVEAATSDVTSRLEASAGRLGERIDEVSTRLEDSTANLADRLETTSIRLSSRLGEVASSLTSALDTTQARLYQHLESQSGAMTQRFATTSSEVVQTLSQSGEAMFSRIDTAARELGKRFDVATSMLEEVTGEVINKMDGTGEQFTKILDDRAGQIYDELGRARSAFAEGLDGAKDEIIGELGRVSSAFASGLENNTALTTRRLDDAGVKFADHLNKASSILADTLGGAAQELDRRLETISTELTGRLEQTSVRVSGRLEDASTLIDHSVERFHTEIERVLHSREDVLAGLLDQLSRRHAEVDGNMRNYISLISERLTSAEARTEEIGRLFVSQTDAASNNLQDEIRRLEQVSDAAIASAARTLQTQHEKLMAAINQAIAATATEFGQTAQELRSTAQQVIKEVDFVRAELKRSILELPEETRQNADAMRRVVSDQITALNALADVVRRQAGALGLSGAGVHVAPPPRETGKDNGTAKVEAVAVVPVPSPPARNSTRKSQGQPRSEASEDQSLTAVKGRPVESLIRGPAKEGSADLMPALAAGGNGRNKAAAPPRETETLVAKLNAAARDLVEALDGSTPPELESQYAAGEGHVYTHHLYLRRGNKMLKEVASRYERERQVRGRLDAFVRLFERLLDTVAEGPRGEDMVDACLNSESGKVYLLLGQASGRLHAGSRQ